MKEEQYIFEKAGKQNPFKVPEGYFETLTSQVMAQIDAAGAVAKEVSLDIDDKPQPKARVTRIRPAYYAVAAGVCALFISVAAYMSFNREASDVTTPEVVAYQTDDETFEEVADYVMLDNQDIYACLSGDY